MKLVCNVTRGKNIESQHMVYAVVIDENQRANEPATMKICNHLNLLMPNEKKKLNKYITKKLFNHRHIHIGNIEATLI